MEPTPTTPPKLNIVELIHKTLSAVMARVGLPENPPTVRMVLTCMMHVASDWNKVLGDDPVHIEKLFHAFLTGTPAEIKAAVQLFGEAFGPEGKKPEEKKIILTGIQFP